MCLVTEKTMSAFASFKLEMISSRDRLLTMSECDRTTVNPPVVHMRNIVPMHAKRRHL